MLVGIGVVNVCGGVGGRKSVWRRSVWQSLEVFGVRDSFHACQRGPRDWDSEPALGRAAGDRPGDPMLPEVCDRGQQARPGVPALVLERDKLAMSELSSWLFIGYPYWNSSFVGRWVIPNLYGDYRFAVVGKE